ncbi:Mrr restriction system protein [Gammaproteobacteria bacterium]|nr:Mrr restriction system protein [Gammaproteobacteria bacterium]
MKSGFSSRTSEISAATNGETARRLPIESVKQQVAEWIQTRRNEKAPVLKALLTQMRQEPDNGVLHYEFAFHLLAIPLPIMEEKDSTFWHYLHQYSLYHEQTRDVTVAQDHLKIALALNMSDHLVAAKARYLTISLFMAEHDLLLDTEEIEEYPYLKNLVQEMIHEGQKYSRSSPDSIESLYIQSAGYEFLGNTYGVEEVDQALERTYSLQVTDVEQNADNALDVPTQMEVRNDGIQFEDKVKRLLLAMGFNAVTTKSTRDGGIDIIAHSRNPVFSGKYIVQCKNWAGSVGEPIIRDLFGVVMAERANKGILITSGQITASSRQFAEDKQLELIDGNDLQALFKQYQVS